MYKIYTVEYCMNMSKHQQDENETDQLKELSMDDDDAIEELTYLLLQTGDHMYVMRDPPTILHLKET